MPRAEFGSSKYVANRMKSKGLQRLRWYCQVCEKQCRDENGFKCHTQSESHVRQMQLVSQNPKSVIEDFSKQFASDFIRQLRTSHNTKAVHINRFYQEYIANKEHIHMNATKWPSLTEFAKHLGKEGICRVEETDKGLHISWIDNSPEALRRQDAIKKQERMHRGDEEREQRQIENQIQRANQQARAQTKRDDGPTQPKMAEGQKIAFAFGLKPTTESKPLTPPPTESSSGSQSNAGGESGENDSRATETDSQTITPPAEEKIEAKPFKMTLGPSSGKPKNVFAAAAKKNALAGKATAVVQPPKKMSEAERIMKEEIERKRRAEERGFNGPNGKRLKTA